MLAKVHKFCFGERYAVRGLVFYDGRPSIIYYKWTVPIWKTCLKHMFSGRWFKLELRKSGVCLRYEENFFMVFWKPYSPGYVDKKGSYQKSKRFQFLTFNINEINNNKKGSIMNDRIQANVVVGKDVVPGDTVPVDLSIPATLVRKEDKAKAQDGKFVQTPEDKAGVTASQ